MTYSLLARDPRTGQMGVATQSQALAVGNSVPWALTGFGIIATQSMGEPAYGQLGLEAMRAGLTATEALTALRSVDPHPERRQVAMIDSQGDIALYTGEGCFAAAGHLVGDNCCAVANLVASDAVWKAMVETFENTTGDQLAPRLLAALHAAEAEGGDLRGRRSAAVLVVRSERSGRPWRDIVVDHRIDDHPHPVTELDKIVQKSTRYHQVVTALEKALDGQTPAAAKELDALPPEDLAADPDQAMWRAIILALAHRDQEARQLLTTLQQTAPQFLEVARQFESAGLIQPGLLQRILQDSHGKSREKTAPVASSPTPAIQKTHAQKS